MADGVEGQEQIDQKAGEPAEQDERSHSQQSRLAMASSNRCSSNSSGNRCHTSFRRRGRRCHTNFMGDSV